MNEQSVTKDSNYLFINDITTLTKVFNHTGLVWIEPDIESWHRKKPTLDFPHEWFCSPRFWPYVHWSVSNEIQIVLCSPSKVKNCSQALCVTVILCLWAHCPKIRGICLKTSESRWSSEKLFPLERTTFDGPSTRFKSKVTYWKWSFVSQCGG